MSFISREIETALKRIAGSYPVITITGPRQSGKTTLCRMCFPDMDYVSLEAPDVRQFALEDPRRFLSSSPKGMVIDEIQRVPDLNSYIQGIVDDPSFPGRFVLTGSRNFRVMEAVNQSLAGRTGILTLLPFTYGEIERIDGDHGVDHLLWAGGYPRIHHRKLNPVNAMRDYTETYLERDVRQITMVQDLLLFQRFMRLCSGRTTQLLNLARLSGDTGVALTTIKAWLSILEASYVVFRLPSFQGNIGKRLIKTPKLFFHDTGLAAYLTGVNSVEQLPSHPLRGQFFENLVVTEVMKFFHNMGLEPRLFFYRDSNGNEVDIVIQNGSALIPVEVKSGMTIQDTFFRGIENFRSAVPGAEGGILVFGGEGTYSRRGVQVTGLSGIHDVLSSLMK